jgi:hypothetical protein
MSEVFRVLTNGGRFIEITFGTPAQRFPVMRRVRRNWVVHPPILVPQNDETEGSWFDYIYVFEKHDP